MTAETVAEEPGAATAPEDRPFSKADIDGFDADDATAGRAIGKMLSLFFVYTLIAMGIAAYWTWSSVVE